jgi:hypothetical protein
LEEDSWIATREQAEKANRHSKIANAIAIASALFALLALIMQFMKP